MGVAQALARTSTTVSAVKSPARFVEKRSRLSRATRQDSRPVLGEANCACHNPRMVQAEPPGVPAVSDEGPIASAPPSGAPSLVGGPWRVLVPALLGLILPLLMVLGVEAPLAQEKAEVRPGSPAAATAIPIAEVATRAEEVTAKLRALDDELAQNPQIAEIEKELPQLSERIKERSSRTDLALTSTDLVALDGLSESWQSSRLTLVDWMRLLTRRAVGLEQELEGLASLRQVWTQTRGNARDEKAPAPVLERIDAVLETVATARKRAESRRSAILVLQANVAKELSRCEQALAQIADARRSATGRLFMQDSPPIWSAEGRARRLDELPARVRESVAAEVTLLQRFVGDESDRIILHVAFILGLTGFLVWVRWRRRRTRPDENLPSLGKVFEHPLAAALILGSLGSSRIYTDEMRVARALIEIGLSVPVVVIVRTLIPAALTPSLYTLAGFFVADRLQDLAAGLPLLERVLFLLEMLAAVVWLLVSPRMRRVLVSRDESAFDRLLRFATRLALAGFLVAFISGVIGYMGLARLLGSGILASAYAAIVIYAGLALVEDLVVFALHARPLRLLQLVERYRPRLQAWATGVLRWGAIAAWTMTSLAQFGLLTPVVAGARRVLTAELARGSLRISLGDVLAFVLTVWVAYLISSAVRFVLQEDVFPRLNLSAGVPYALSNLLSYVIVAAGFIVGLAVLGLNLDRFTILGGAFGVGVGFGLQNIVNNFGSGLIVLFERPVRVGDVIQIGDVVGSVERIGIRSSTVRTGLGADVIVPNSMLVADKVTNWTPVTRRRRVDVQLSVAYGTAPDKVVEVLTQVAGAQPDVCAVSAPAALCLGFVDSGLTFELRVWTEPLDQVDAVKSDLGLAVSAALSEGGMTLALPQREIVVRQGQLPGPER